MPAPLHVQAMAGDNLAHVGWVPTFGAVEYRVERAASANGPWTTVGRGPHRFPRSKCEQRRGIFLPSHCHRCQWYSFGSVRSVEVLIDPRGGGVVSAINIPRVSGITVDGRLDDWLGVYSIYIDPAWVADAPDVYGDADLSGQAYLGYDDDYFYIAVRVTDDVLIFERDTVDIWQTDAVELWLNDAQIGLTRNVNGDDIAYVWSGGLNAASIEVAVVIEANGYTVEAAIPRAEVEKVVSMSPGSSFKLAIGMDDSDVSGAERKVKSICRTVGHGAIRAPSPTPFLTDHSCS